MIFEKKPLTEPKNIFFGGIQQHRFYSGESPPPTSMVRHLGQRFDEGITLTVWITTSLQVRDLCSCFTAAWHYLVLYEINKHTDLHIGPYVFLYCVFIYYTNLVFYYKVECIKIYIFGISVPYGLISQFTLIT